MGARAQESAGTYIIINQIVPLTRSQSRAVIGTTGGWRDSHRMSEAVERGDIDMCGLGRPLREDPFFPKRVLRGEIRMSRL